MTVVLITTWTTICLLDFGIRSLLLVDFGLAPYRPDVVLRESVNGKIDFVSFIITICECVRDPFHFFS